MIQIKQNLNKKEKEQVRGLLNELTDVYSDFYITRNNLRLFIKENQDLLFKCLSKGDKIAFSETGLLFITGWSDNANRKYIKILTENEEDAHQLIKILGWHIQEDLYAKIKKNNPLVGVLERSGFRFVGSRGKEVLLCRRNFSHKQKVVKRTDDAEKL